MFLDWLLVWAVLRQVVPADTLAQAGRVDPSLLQQYGPGGAVVLVLLPIFWLILKSEREEKRAAQAEVRELNKVAREQMIPALIQATGAITEAMRTLRKDHRS